MHQIRLSYFWQLLKSLKKKDVSQISSLESKSHILCGVKRKRCLIVANLLLRCLQRLTVGSACQNAEVKVCVCLHVQTEVEEGGVRLFL